MSAEERLRELKIDLPEAPVALGSYTPARFAGDMLYLSGSGPVLCGKPVYSGKVGADVTLEEAKDAARIAAINQLSLMKACLGSLDRVEGVVKLLGFVAAAPGFYAHPKVIDGASELLTAVFGESGLHARSAVGVASLPMNIPVEIEMAVKLKPAP